MLKNFIRILKIAILTIASFLFARNKIQREKIEELKEDIKNKEENLKDLQKEDEINKEKEESSIEQYKKEKEKTDELIKNSKNKSGEGKDEKNYNPDDARNRIDNFLNRDN